MLNNLIQHIINEQTFDKYKKEDLASTDCKNYRSDTEQCKTGCPKSKVIAGNVCPFGNQKECPCYK